jgi:hypothetical protein
MCVAPFQARSSAEEARHRPMRGFTLVAQRSPESEQRRTHDVGCSYSGRANHQLPDYRSHRPKSSFGAMVCHAQQFQQ